MLSRLFKVIGVCSPTKRSPWRARQLNVCMLSSEQQACVVL